MLFRSAELARIEALEDGPERDHAQACWDEFYGWLPYCEMLRLLDRYPCQVQIKCGSLNFAPREIIILSNKAPEDWYDKTKCAWEPLERRIESYGQMMPGGEIMWLKQTE